MCVFSLISSLVWVRGVEKWVLPYFLLGVSTKRLLGVRTWSSEIRAPLCSSLGEYEV